MGPGLMSHNPIMGMGPRSLQWYLKDVMGFPLGFPPVQSPPQQVPFLTMAPVGAGQLPRRDGFPRRRASWPPPATCPKVQQMQHFASLRPGGNLTPSLSWETACLQCLQTQIYRRSSDLEPPEYLSLTLSRIIPSEKPTDTAIFPSREVPVVNSPRNPLDLPHMQGMMGEQAPRMGLALPGMGGPGSVGTPDIPLGTVQPCQATTLWDHQPFSSKAWWDLTIGWCHSAQSTMPGQPTLDEQSRCCRGHDSWQGSGGLAGFHTHPGPVGSPGMMMSMQGAWWTPTEHHDPPHRWGPGMAAGTWAWVDSAKDLATQEIWCFKLLRLDVPILVEMRFQVLRAAMRDAPEHCWSCNRRTETQGQVLWGDGELENVWIYLKTNYSFNQQVCFF